MGIDYYNQYNTQRQATSSLTTEEWVRRCALKTAQVDKLCEMGKGILPDEQRTRAAACGKLLTMVHTDDLLQSRLELGYFCGARLCPACAWRKAAKDATRISCILQRALDDKYMLIFATLTAANCGATELQQQVRAYGRAYNALMHRLPYSRTIKGHLRKLEITYNQARDDYHPHLHFVWAVRYKDWYAHPINKLQLSDDWRAMLRAEGCNADVSDLAQDIRPVRAATRDQVLEYAKYPAKSGDYLHGRDQLQAYYSALRGARLITYAGVLREYNSEYEDGLLDAYKQRDDADYWLRSVWEWDGAEYYQDTMYRMSDPVRFGTCDTDEGVRCD